MLSPRRIGPFEVVRLLGQGGMGVVYEVKDPLAPRTLALKLVRHAGASESAVARFWREAELLARVRHPGVVAIHKLGRAPEGLYLLQDLVPGAPLSATCDGEVAATRAAELVRDLARAVEAVHALGILHRDLKPQNVMLLPDGRPVLLDFGLARDVDAETITRSGAPIGTPVYMSPEQALGGRGRPIDARTDVYGLGAILYELLSGSPPFAGEGIVQVLNQVVTEEPAPLEQRRPGLPEELSAICHVALAKDPGERFASAGALAVDLERFLAGAPTEAGARLATVRARRWRRRAAVAGGVALVVALLAAAAALPLRRDVPLPAPITTTTPVPAAPAAPPPLWSLTPGESLRLRSTVEEDEPSQGFRFEVELDVVAGEAAGDRAHLTATCTALAVAFGAPSIGGLRFDTRTPDPAHPLAGVSAGVGRTFTLEVDLRSGALFGVAGLDAIGAAIVARPPAGSPLFSSALYERVCGTTFSDRYVEAVLRAASEVRPGGVTLAWSSGDGSTFTVAAAAPAACVVPPRGISRRARAEDRFRYEGRAVYARGLLREGRVSQVLVGREAREGELRPPRPGDAVVTRWTVEVQRLPR